MTDDLEALVTTAAPHPPPARDWAVLAGLLVVCVGGGGLLGALFASQTDAYTAYDLPSWAPPSWLFGPVWTVLYALMAVSAWRVWRHREAAGRQAALVAFGVQLVLNFAWTPAFFGADAPALGLAVIVGVLLAVAWWVVTAWRVERLAGALQLPYLGWVGFATALNAAIVW